MAEAVTDRTPEKLIKLYKRMADMTLPECQRCRVPYGCCSPEYCEFSIAFAKERGVELRPTGHPRLPMMGKTGCVVPPHLRPMCTYHTCDMNSFGIKKGDKTGEWTNKYYDLRGEIEEEEAKLLEGQQL